MGGGRVCVWTHDGDLMLFVGVNRWSVCEWWTYFMWIWL